ncbi:MAG: hypothetical protein AAFV53_10415 [Myxococcota bacterium]
MTIPTDRLWPADRPAVLVTSGAYNPVHRNHLLYLDAARAFLEQPANPDAIRGPEDAGPSAPLQVVGGYISALSDRMVARRRGGAIPRRHRTTMLRLATASSDWVMVIGASLRGARLFRSIAEQAAETVGRPVTVIAVCGTDGYASSDGFLPRDIPLACVRRPGDDGAWKTLWETASPRRRLYLIEDNHQPQPRSATQIRRWLQQADADALTQLRAHLHPDVLHLLLQHPEWYAS